MLFSRLASEQEIPHLHMLLAKRAVLNTLQQQFEHEFWGECVSLIILKTCVLKTRVFNDLS